MLDSDWLIAVIFSLQIQALHWEFAEFLLHVGVFAQDLTFFHGICKIVLYNYHPCRSVTRRFVSQRKVRSPEGLTEGGLTFRGETSGRVTLQQG